MVDTTPPTITAVLGPTNTGKTHYAIERMLGYQSGIIGFPLRRAQLRQEQRSGGLELIASFMRPPRLLLLLQRALELLL